MSQLVSEARSVDLSHCDQSQLRAFSCVGWGTTRINS